MKFLLLFLSILVTALAGCGYMNPVKAASDFYEPLTSAVYPPKPADCPVPILATAPKRPFKIIGKLYFRSGEGSSFITKVIEYCSRQNGADAVIMVGSGATNHAFSHTIPGHTSWVPVTTYSSGSAFGTASYYGSSGSGTANFTTSGSSVSRTSFPVYNPPETRTNVESYRWVDAVMIRYK
jgi:hypothetical protein